MNDFELAAASEEWESKAKESRLNTIKHLCNEVLGEELHEELLESNDNAGDTDIEEDVPDDHSECDGYEEHLDRIENSPGAYFTNRRATGCYCEKCSFDCDWYSEDFCEEDEPPEPI